jgi:mRNA interferase RelE/StbE
LVHESGLLHQSRASEPSGHRNRATQIRAKIEQYAANPAELANNVIQLSGSSAKRLRIAGFRVLFTETETTITVLDVGPRGEIYE